MTINVSIDWNHDGDYADTNENVTAYVLAAEWRVGRANPDDEMPTEGSLTLTLNNQDRRFSPDYADSPLYGNLKTGRRIKITANAGAGDVILWQGWLQYIELSIGQYGERQAIVYGAQGIYRLRQAKAALPVRQNATADTILNAVMPRVAASAALNQSWMLGEATMGEKTRLYQPAEQFISETGRTTFLYYGDQLDSSASVDAVIAEVVTAERGVFWQARDGVFHFRNRHVWLLDATTPDVVTVDTEAVGAAYEFGGGLATVIQVTCYPREIGVAGAVIWTSTTPLEIPALGERSLKISVDEVGNGRRGILSVVSPQRTTDFTAVDALGVDRTAFVTVSVSLEGGGARVLIQNQYLMPLTVTLSLRGQTLTRYNALTIEVTNDSALPTYGRLVLERDFPALSHPDEAESYARWLLNRLSSPRGYLNRLHLRHRDAAALTRMVNWTFGKRLTVSEYQSGGVGKDYFIVGEAFTYTPETGLEAVYTLLPDDPTPYWILQSGTLGSQSYLGY
jgi:hypothetical protein